MSTCGGPCLQGLLAMRFLDLEIPGRHNGRFSGARNIRAWCHSERFAESAAALDSVATSDQVLVEPVSFRHHQTLHIVCGLPALPHNPLHKRLQDDVYYACLADVALRLMLFVGFSFSQGCRKPSFGELCQIWVDRALRTEIEQESLHQFGHPCEFLLFRRRAHKLPDVIGLVPSPK